jgi:hypothetical protein
VECKDGGSSDIKNHPEVGTDGNKGRVVGRGGGPERGGAQRGVRAQPGRGHVVAAAQGPRRHAARLAALLRQVRPLPARDHVR